MDIKMVNKNTGDLEKQLELYIKKDDMNEILSYLKLLYHVYTGIHLPEFSITEKKVIECYIHDPAFSKIVTMSRDLFPECWRYNEKNEKS